MANLSIDWWSRPCGRLLAQNPATEHAADWTVSSLNKRHGMSDDDDPGYLNCKNSAYILTLWDCTNTGSWELMPEFGKDPTQGLDNTFGYMKWLCEYYHEDFMYTREELDDIYSKTTFKSWDDAAETLTGPIHVNKTMLEPYAVPQIHFHDARAYSEVFGEVLVYFISGVLILQMLYNFCVWVFPKQLAAIANLRPVRFYRRYVTVRPLLGEKLSKKLDLYSTPFPYICLAILVVLNYMFMGIKLNYSHPQPLYGAPHIAAGTHIAYRSGTLCVFKLPFIFLFGTRNNIFIWATGWDMAVFNHWHTWLSRMAIIDAFIHTGAYVVHYGHEGSMEEWSKSYWICGFIALLCWTLMGFHGVTWIKKLSYDFFKICHIALGIASVATLWFHLDFTHKFEQLWYTLIAVWIFDWVLRCFRLKASGACKAVVQQTTEDYYTVYVEDHSPIKPYAGAHYYLYFWEWPIFWQSHPFTVADSRDGYLKFVFKVQKGMTKVVAEKVRASGGSREFTIGLEGPLGVVFNFASFENLVFLAGGVGITAVYGHLKPWVRTKVDRPTTVHWAIRDHQPLECFSDEIEAMQRAGINLVIYVTGGDGTPGSEALSLKSEFDSLSTSSDAKQSDLKIEAHTSIQCVKPHRPDLPSIIAAEMLDTPGSLVYFACGSPEFNRTAREAIANNLCKTKNYVEFYEEAFS